MAESGNKSSGSADSYIGSIISLISKSDIRYEGVLGGINTEESTIELHHVKSYGTEGRRKDGPQILPNDAEYNYILFRGSDIKDLQVKSSAPVHAEQQIHDDPAIIQSHYSQGPPSTATSVPVVSRTVTGSSTLGEPSDLPRPMYQGASPSYQSGEYLGSLGYSTPNVDGGSHARPMHWNGYSGSSSSFPIPQQQPLPFQPPNTMPGRLNSQNQFQYPEVQVPAGTNNASLSEHPPPVNRTGYFLPYMSSGFTPAAVSSSHPSDFSSSQPMKTSVSPNLSSVTTDLLTTPSLSSFNQNMTASVDPFANKSGIAAVSGLPIQSSASSILGSASGPPLTVLPPLLTPGQLIQPGPLAAPSSTQSVLHEEKNIDALVPLSSKPLLSVTSPPIQVPLLPLPHSSGQFQNSTTQYTEEFDFIAMNEKFKKDEVWGFLGKANQKNKTEGIESNQIYQSEGADGGYRKNSEFDDKPVYVKDEFFDTLSSNCVNRGRGTNYSHGRGANFSQGGGTNFSQGRGTNFSQGGGTNFSQGRGNNFSQRMKLDTETFGSFQQRPNMSRGGHGFGRGGYYGDSNNRGRGYSYGIRGRGGYMP